MSRKKNKKKNKNGVEASVSLQMGVGIGLNHIIHTLCESTEKYLNTHSLKKCVATDTFGTVEINGLTYEVQIKLEPRKNKILGPLEEFEFKTL